VTPESFREDPLRIVRGLRFASELDFALDDTTVAQMREQSDSVGLVSAERIGGGLAADGLGELSRLLLGAQPAKALRVARDTGVLVAVLPEYAPALGFDQESKYHALPVDEHHFEAVQRAADADSDLGVRLALLLHDLGKPVVAWRGNDGRLHYYGRNGNPGHEEVGAELARTILARLRYPVKLQQRVSRIVREHGFAPPTRADPRRARQFLQRHGAQLALDLLAHKEFDLRAKGRPVGDDLEKLARFRALVHSEISSPHRLSDLAIDGSDLIALGFVPGPELGHVLRSLLERVVEDPSSNTREQLLAAAEELR
jgi:tRNA nucleotidyltransferase (CCA-adding enzyme)